MRPDPRKQETRAINRAGILSRSGLYSCWEEVQAALVAEGYPNAQEALKSTYLRNLLNQHCVEARRNHHA